MWSVASWGRTSAEIRAVPFESVALAGQGGSRRRDPIPCIPEIHQSMRPRSWQAGVVTDDPRPCRRLRSPAAAPGGSPATAGAPPTSPDLVGRAGGVIAPPARHARPVARSRAALLGQLAPQNVGRWLCPGVEHPRDPQLLLEQGTDVRPHVPIGLHITRVDGNGLIVRVHRVRVQQEQ